MMQGISAVSNRSMSGAYGRYLEGQFSVSLWH